MQPEKLGKVLGISARVAAKTIRERAAQAQAAGTAKAPAAGGTVRPAARQAGAAAGQTAARAAASAGQGGKRLARGAGRFGSTLLRPFARAGSILGLQIAGVFFSMFALFFVSHAAQTMRAAGWHDRHGQIYAGLALVFAWFTVSSFWRAKVKGRR
jgi:hypothetical protein